MCNLYITNKKNTCYNTLNNVKFQNTYQTMQYMCNAIITRWVQSLTNVLPISTTRTYHNTHCQQMLNQKYGINFWSSQLMRWPWIKTVSSTYIRMQMFDIFDMIAHWETFIFNSKSEIKRVIMLYYLYLKLGDD